MARKHAILVTLALGLAAVLGTVALGRTLGIGTTAHKANDAVIAKRTQQLNRFEASLKHQLAQKPKPVALPAATPQAQTQQAQAPIASTNAPQRVVYVRPKPIIIHKHRAGGEYEAEGAEHEGGTDD